MCIMLICSKICYVESWNYSCGLKTWFSFDYCSCYNFVSCAVCCIYSLSVLYHRVDLVCDLWTLLIVHLCLLSLLQKRTLWILFNGLCSLPHIPCAFYHCCNVCSLSLLLTKWMTFLCPQPEYPPKMQSVFYLFWIAK